jgi:CRP-like cAMP-binding protein
VLRKGAIVGQIALVDREPRSATLRAETPVVALELTRDAFEQLLHAHSPLAIRFQMQIAVACARQLRGSSQRLASVLEQRSIAAQVETTKPAARVDARNETLRYIQAAVNELELSLDDLDNMEVVLAPQPRRSSRSPAR